MMTDVVIAASVLLGFVVLAAVGVVVLGVSLLGEEDEE